MDNFYETCSDGTIPINEAHDLQPGFDMTVHELVFCENNNDFVGFVTFLIISTDNVNLRPDVHANGVSMRVQCNNSSRTNSCHFEE